MKLKNLIITAASLCILCTSLKAQTNAVTTNALPPIPTGPLDFIQQAGSWISNVNTNETWSNTKVDLWTAANFQSGLQTSAEIGLSYDAFGIATNVVIAPEAVFRNAGIAGVIVSYQGGIGFSYEHFDIKATAYGDFGYSPSQSTAFAEIGARLKKKMTTSTYAAIGIYYDFNFKGRDQQVPGLVAFMGWDF